jgi:sugar fermentation stimulation protein A
MTYGPIVTGAFLSRPNRFIAMADIGGRIQACHVCNTGRCKELLTRGAVIYLEENTNPARKTRYDLVAVQKGSLLINMDSRAPNRAAAEYLPQLFAGCTRIKPEAVHGESRLDFYIETPEDRIFMEVKGVTLEANGIAMFPDAPTVRGVKHLYELCRCAEEGYKACALFVIQMKGIAYFTPNDAAHPEFGAALRYASGHGVRLLAMDCTVTPGGMTINQPVAIRLWG